MEEKIPEQSDYWLIAKQNKFFETAFAACFKSKKDSYIGGYIFKTQERSFEDVIEFFCAQRLYSTTYTKRLEDWANMLKIGAENSIGCWQQIKNLKG